LLETFLRPRQPGCPASYSPEKRRRPAGRTSTIPRSLEGSFVQSFDCASPARDFFMLIALLANADESKKIVVKLGSLPVRRSVLLPMARPRRTEDDWDRGAWDERRWGRCLYGRRGGQ